MSRRMFPCLRMSMVVRPEMLKRSSAGLISTFSTASKSMPFFVPNGRMMNARIFGALRFFESAETIETEVLHFDLPGQLLADAYKILDSGNRIKLRNLRCVHIAESAFAEPLRG